MSLERRHDDAGIAELGFAPGERSRILRSLERCGTDQCPFARPPLLRDLVWVEPTLVVGVRSLASETGRWLREPVFSRVVGLRAATEAAPTGAQRAEPPLHP